MTISRTAHRVLLAGAASLAIASAAAGTANAEQINASKARSISLGGVAGVAYYTVERDGYRVIATLAQAETGAPVRFEALLAPGQSVVLSSPREAGVAPSRVEISRQGDRVLVQDGALTH